MRQPEVVLSELKKWKILMVLLLVTRNLFFNMNNTSTITFRQLVILEQHFDSTYRSIKTVREMCSDLTDSIYWDKEDPNTIYHQFETKSGPNQIVKDDQIVKLTTPFDPLIDN